MGLLQLLHQVAVLKGGLGETQHGVVGGGGQGQGGVLVKVEQGDRGDRARVEGDNGDQGGGAIPLHPPYLEQWWV